MSVPMNNFRERCNVPPPGFLDLYIAVICRNRTQSQARWSQDEPPCARCPAPGVIHDPISGRSQLLHVKQPSKPES